MPATLRFSMIRNLPPTIRGLVVQRVFGRQTTGSWKYVGTGKKGAPFTGGERPATAQLVTSVLHWRFRKQFKLTVRVKIRALHLQIAVATNVIMENNLRSHFSGQDRAKYILYTSFEKWFKHHSFSQANFLKLIHNPTDEIESNRQTWSK